MPQNIQASPIICGAFFLPSPFALGIQAFMKILVIDTDSERVRSLKTLESESHLVQTFGTWSEARPFLDQVTFQILVLGPEQISGKAVTAISEWRKSLGEKPSPWVVALGPRQDTPTGIDHFLQMPIDEKTVSALPGLAAVPPEPDAIDYPAALEICDGDEDLLREVADIYLADGPQRMERLIRAKDDSNWEDVQEAAHLIKGSALNLSAETLRIAAGNLERAGKAGNQAHILFWYEQVVYEFQRLESRLRGWLGGPAASL